MIYRRLLPLCIALLMTSCIYEFPVTVEPTRKIDTRLIGTWLGGKAEETVEVREFDEGHYVLLNDGKFYRAYISEVNGVPIVNIQSIDSTDVKERKYWFVSYDLSGDGSKLSVRSVNKDTVPDTAKSSQEIEKLIKDNLKNPKLFNEEAMTYRRKTEHDLNATGALDTLATPIETGLEELKRLANPLKTFIRLMTAIETNDYDSFVADGDATFKAGGTKQILEGTSKLMAPRLKAGCEKTYLAQLKQKGFDVYVWKLTFKDGGDDILAKLVMKDGKVGGFWLQ